jgi:diguanylate cyclase (GGDEF)-like protein
MAVAYLDMNGLKQINDRCGHDAGDHAIKTFFQTVVSSLGDRGEAYRLGSGGDEVLVVLPNSGFEAAIQFLKMSCTTLMSERIENVDASLSIAAGVIICTDSSASPSDLRSAADQTQLRAKERSKKDTPRPSVIAYGRDDLLVIPGKPGL